MAETATNIIGIGAVSGYGWGRTSLWDGLLSGKPAAALFEGYGIGGDDAWPSLRPGAA